MTELPTTKSELVAKIAAGSQFDFTFFWGHQKSKDGSVTKACCSQWWHSPFSVNGVSFPTAEHYMMYRKAMLFCDKLCAEQILKAPSPKEAKMLGRRVNGFSEGIWLKHRDEITFTGNQLKFSQNQAIRAFLESTRNSILVEASPVDLTWGIGLAEDSPVARIPAQWPGLNLLGFTLTRVRAALLEGSIEGRAVTP